MEPVGAEDGRVGDSLLMYLDFALREGGGTGFESVASGGAAAGILRLGAPLGAQKRPSTFRGDWDDRNSA